MKTFLTTVVSVLASVSQALSEPVKLNGDFVPDQAKSIAWMKENRYPGAEGEGKLERYKKAAYSGTPVIHRWAEGKLEVLISDDWKEPYTREWIEVSPASYKSVKPKDKTNTEQVTMIQIANPDNYYLEITVNERTTREYFTRKETEKKTGEAGAGQPAVRPVVEPKGGDKPQPAAGGRGCH